MMCDLRIFGVIRSVLFLMRGGVWIRVVENCDWRGDLKNGNLRFW